MLRWIRPPNPPVELIQRLSEVHTKELLDCLDQRLITTLVQTDEDAMPSAVRLPSCSPSSDSDMKNRYFHKRFGIALEGSPRCCAFLRRLRATTDCYLTRDRVLFEYKKAMNCTLPSLILTAY